MNATLIFFIVYVIVLLVVELLSYILIKNLRKDFQWLITPKDELPVLNKDGLNKFIKHGYDEELGWVRKPNTEKNEIGRQGITKYHIDKHGSRKNPGHEKLKKKIIKALPINFLNFFKEYELYIILSTFRLI